MFPESSGYIEKRSPKIELAADGIVDEEIAGAVAHDLAVEHQVGAVHDGQGFAHVVVA